MALYFDVGGSGNQYHAERTTSLGTSTSDTTVMFLFRSTKSTTNQGTFFGVNFGGSSNHHLFNNGTSLYLGTGTGHSGAFSVLPSTTAWYICAFRRSSSLYTGNWYGSIYNGSTWTHINSTAGSGSKSIDRIWCGFETGDVAMLRQYCVNGAEVAHIRLWTNTHLSDAELETESASHTPVKAGITAAFTCVDNGTDSEGGDSLSLSTTYPTFDSDDPAPGNEPYSATGSTGIQNFEGFQASQIGLHRNIEPGIAYFNAQGFAPSTSAGFQFDAQTGYANFVGFNSQSIQDEIGIAGRINFNTGTHQTHVTREFFGLLGQLRALGFLVDQTNSQGFFPNLGSIVFQGPTGATVTVFSAPTTFTATSILRETHFVGFQAQLIRDFFPLTASTHALGFTPQYVEFIKEITGPDQGQANFSGFQAQAIILGQINDAIGQKGEVNLVGFQHAVDMWRTLDILQGRINMQGFAAGVALFQGGTINLSGVTGEVNFDTLQQAIGMYRTFYPDSGLTNAEGYVPVPSTGTLVQSIVGILNHEGFIPFIVAERYRGIVGEMRLEGFAPTIGGGLWTPKRRRATSWAAIN